MKRSLFLFFLLFCFLFLLPIPKYQELNHLILIDTMEIKCDIDSYHINLREIIPIREDDGIQYHYKEHQLSGSNLLKLRKKMQKKSFYYKGVRKVLTNCSIEDVSAVFKISKYIIQKK